MTAQTTTQRTAKHRRKRAEESARMRSALEVIAGGDNFAATIARHALYGEIPSESS